MRRVVNHTYHVTIEMFAEAESVEVADAIVGEVVRRDIHLDVAGASVLDGVYSVWSGAVVRIVAVDEGGVFGGEK